MMRSLEKNKSCCCYFARTERLEEYKSCNLKSNLMEEHLNPIAVTHLLQHTLRSLCIHENSQWVYAIFWRILPRNYPPPKWDGQGAYDRSRGNRRNWILVWEDGFCNFAASTTGDRMNSGSGGDCPTSSAVYGNCHEFQQYQGLQPELFFKMSHEIYNYGEGLIGKVAADHSHKLVYKEPNDQEINFLSAWHNSADSHPRTWEAQFQSGIKTIALIAVREGVVQLGAVHKVIEDLSYVVLLRKKFSYIESIPGVLLPHPSSSAFPNYKIDGYGGGTVLPADHHHHQTWQHYHHQGIGTNIAPQEFYDHHQHFNNQMLPFKNITPSMSSLEALLSKLPSVVPPHHHQQQQQQEEEAAAAAAGGGGGYSPIQYLSTTQTHQIMDHDDDHHQQIGIMEKGVAAKEEIDEEEEEEEYRNEIGETSSSITAAAAAAAYRKQQFHQQQQLQDLNVSSRPSCSGFFE